VCVSVCVCLCVRCSRSAARTMPLRIPPHLTQALDLEISATVSLDLKRGDDLEQRCFAVFFHPTGDGDLGSSWPFDCFHQHLHGLDPPLEQRAHTCGGLLGVVQRFLVGRRRKGSRTVCVR
jgi:hypothetical protein